MRRSLLAVCVLALAGCGAPAAGADAKPAPSPTRWPASLAGGACQMLDFDTVASFVGTSFDVAAASQTGNTFTCVLEQTKAKLPDLVLSVTQTQADAGIFTKTVVPKGATTVAGLGKAGYSTAAPDAAEVGWLTSNQRIITVRLHAGDAPTLLPKLVALAKELDQTA